LITLDQDMALQAERLRNGQHAQARENGYDPIYSELEWPVARPMMFHGLAGDIVRLIEPETESDPVAILIHFLTFFGCCAGRNVYVQVEGSRHYLNLNAVLVGSTSKGRKGTAEGRTRSLFELVEGEWVNHNIATGLASGEGLIWGVRNPIYKQEALREKRVVVGYQKVLVDEGIEDKRLLIVESEFASPLRVMARDGNTLSATIRQAWDTGNLRILNKNSPAIATDAHISIIGHITAEELRRNLDQTEISNGFANRFLWTLVARSKLLPEGGKPLDQTSLNSLVSRLQEAIQFARDYDNVIKRDDSARELWFEVYGELSISESGLLGSVTSRAEAQVTRLSALYAVLDLSPWIKREHVEAALAVWKYCFDSAAYTFGRATGNKDADLILKALAQGVMTKTEISDGLFKRHKSAGDIDVALQLLTSQGKIKVESLKTEGRNATRYSLAGVNAEK
jgi:hypothetical protein